MNTRILAIVLTSATAASAAGPLKFERVEIGNVTYEASSVFDVDRDGKLDIVCGEYWFAGPDFQRAHRIAEIMRVEDYYDDFSDYPMDVNGDGWLDVVTGGWWGATLTWRENPKGRDELWKVHEIDKCGNIETIRYWDVDGDGHVEVCPNAGGRVAAYKLVRDAKGKGTGRFTRHVIKPDGCGHGLGYGDLNGDGRGDFIVPDGWIEAPAKPLEDKWTFHPEFKLGTTSVPVLVHDVNGDGRADMIEGQAHGYGLNWWEQRLDDAGKRTWTKHEIDPGRSQYHDLMLFDIDKDSKPELITGKRYRAHLGKDPGSADPLGVYYFEINGGAFERVTLDYGPAERASGVGLYFWIADLDANGWPDIVAPGKEGLFLFKNQGPLSGTDTGAKKR